MREPDGKRPLGRPRRRWEDNIKKVFYMLVAVHLGIILINNQLDAQFLLYIFISILCMFRATLCSSSGESIVSVQLLVYVALCW
jgi:hypothetical protein